MNRVDWFFVIFLLSMFLVVLPLMAYVISLPEGPREVYEGQLADVEYGGGYSNLTVFTFENGSIVPVRGTHQGLAIGDNVILIVYGRQLSELAINPVEA